MALAIFDLDETLIHGDCSTLWSERMCQLGWADPVPFMAENHALMAAYGRGELTMSDYMRFSLAPLMHRSVADVDRIVASFVDTVIEPRIYPDARNAVAAHRALGDRLIVISASAAHLVRPIARRLGIHDVLAIDPAVEDGCYTGETVGILTYREGKVTRLREWLEDQDESMANACFYSDSRNDLPLLSLVDRPIAVNPDPLLYEHASRAGWPTLRWSSAD